MRVFRILRTILVAALIVGACAPQQANVAPTGTLAPTIIPTPSPLPAASPSVRPTATAAPTPSPTPSPDPYPELGSFGSAGDGYYAINAGTIKETVRYLASKKLQGRRAGTIAGGEAAGYLAKILEDIGVKPVNGDYFQPFELKTEYYTTQAHNVWGIIEGSSKKDEYILITAHFDGLGAIDKKTFFGADDNASGTAAVLEVARAFAALSANGMPSARSVLIVLFDGEEAGLKGSAYFAKHLPVAKEKIIGAINLDMVGRGDNSTVYMYGAPNVKKFKKENLALYDALIAANTVVKLELTYPATNTSFTHSDQWSLYSKGITNVLLLNTGKHSDYHKTTDTADKLNYSKIERIARLVFLTAWQLANKN